MKTIEKIYVLLPVYIVPYLETQLEWKNYIKSTIATFAKICKKSIRYRTLEKIVLKDTYPWLALEIRWVGEDIVLDKLRHDYNLEYSVHTHLVASYDHIYQSRKQMNLAIQWLKT